MAADFDGRSGKLPAAGAQARCRPAANEPAAFEQMVEAYQQRVARLASRLMGWPSDVDDAVQDVFLAVLKNLKKFRGHSSMWTWLARITVNRCHTLRRRRLLRQRLLAGLLWRRREAAADSSDRLGRGETLRQVRQAVLSLPARLRDAAVLRYLEEMSIDEVAEVLGASANTVRVRLHRARELLKTRLGGLVEGEGR